MTVTHHRKPHGRAISAYGFGRTALFACQADQRFSYCLYIPHSYEEDGDTIYPLAVIVHGSLRNAEGYRDASVDFAEAHQVVILAPLFPCGIIEPGEVNNYKYIAFHDIRFDHLLLAMVEEVSQTYRLDAARFLLHGFSGGGHFAHRFFYLHPDRLRGVSVGAPGSVTLLDETRDWWVGVRNLEAEFGIALDLAAMRRVPVHLVIGAEDIETWEITIPRTSPRWMPGAEDAGANRRDRMASLKASLERHGITVEQSVVPGVGHDGFQVLEPVKRFFHACLTGPSDQ